VAGELLQEGQEFRRNQQFFSPDLLALLLSSAAIEYPSAAEKYPAAANHRGAWAGVRRYPDWK